MAAYRGFLFTVLVAVTAAELVGNAAAATYVVGDNLGWTVPQNGPAAYTSWASQHVFRVGDVLVFNFPTGIHDVAHVTKGAFDGCSSTNPIALATAGPSNFTLNSTGESYYICTFGQHCSLGQKLAVNVTGSSTSPAPAPSSPPTPTPTPTPTPAPTPTPTPPRSPSPSPSRTPSPSPSPSQTPSPSPSPSQTPSPGSTPSPSPGGSVTPPPSPGSASSPPGASVPPTGGLSPPPPPSSATITTISGPLVVFASLVFGLMI